VQTEDLIHVENLVKYFPVTAGVLSRKVADVKAVDGVSFHIRKGETLGLVGESGRGRTTTYQAIDICSAGGGHLAACHRV
jgi:ABC-type oligopeptide transport system ATPase subunit